jgi:hypothetical protein
MGLPRSFWSTKWTSSVRGESWINRLAWKPAEDDFHEMENIVKLSR